jgi:hypothetical protein
MPWRSLIVAALLIVAIVVGAAAGVAGVLLEARQAGAARPENACTRLVEDLAAFGGSPKLTPYYLAAVGCEPDPGGVYGPARANGCMRSAFLLYVTGSGIREIRDQLHGSGECAQTEAGGYVETKPG